MVNWKDIHPDFTPELQKEWEERDFNYEEAKEWIKADLVPNDAEITLWLKNKIKITPQEIMNNDEISLEEIREQYQEYLSENQEEDSEVTQSEYLSSEGLVSTLSLSELPEVRKTRELHLDTLARLFTGEKKKKDVCVAIFCYEKKLLVASNQEEAKHAQEYSKELWEFIDSKSSESYKKLIRLTVEQTYAKLTKLSEMKKVFLSKKLRSFKKELKKYKDNKDNLKELQEAARTLFERLDSKDSKTNKKKWDKNWKYLIRWQDTGSIVEAIMTTEENKKIDTNIIEAIRCVEPVKGTKNVHAEMKIIDKLYEEKIEKDSKYIGLTKLTCLDCQSVIETLDKESENRWRTCGKHGKKYPTWVIPEFMKERKKDLDDWKVKNKLRKFKKETTSEVPEKFADIVQLLSEIQVQEQLAQIQIPPK